MKSQLREKDVGKPPAHERLRRLLFLVPYVSKHQGITVDELAKALNLSSAELVDDLEMLALVGRPPFQPDDYIDIYVDDDRVYVDLDQRLSAPPRLTASEAAALASAAQLLRPAAGDALKSALDKLEKVLPPDVRARFREIGQKVDLAGGSANDLAPLTQSINERRELEFDYFTSSRGQTERRNVRPHGILTHHGTWYLSAWCLSRSDDRLFRVDRMTNVSVSDRRYEEMGPSASAVPNPARARGEVRVRVNATSGPYVKELFGDAADAHPDGTVEVRVTGESERWLTQWILSFGGDAEVIEPEWAREAVARAASASLKS